MKIIDFINEKSKVIQTLILVLAVILLCALLSVYFIMFHSGLSEISNDWGNFGSYFGGVGSIALSISLFLYTYYSNKESGKIKEESRVLELLRYCIDLKARIHEYNIIKRDIALQSIYERGKPESKELYNRFDEADHFIHSTFDFIVTYSSLLYMNHGVTIKDDCDIKTINQALVQIIDNIKKEYKEMLIYGAEGIYKAGTVRHRERHGGSVGRTR